MLVPPVAVRRLAGRPVGHDVVAAERESSARRVDRGLRRGERRDGENGEYDRLIIESLQKFHHYYGDDFTVECPVGSGRYLTIDGVAAELSARLARIFLRDESGRRPVFGDSDRLQHDPHFRDYVLFHEYFHGDNGRGMGASHQTGWTALVAKLLLPRTGATAVERRIEALVDAGV